MINLRAKSEHCKHAGRQRVEQDEGQPDRHQMPQTQILSAPGGGKRFIEQFRHAHLFQLGEQQWQIVHSFVHDGAILGSVWYRLSLSYFLNLKIKSAKRKWTF